MLQGAYDIIFKKIKKIKGVSLDDDPYSFQEMIEIFDQYQRFKVHGLQIAEQLIDETRLWLNIIKRLAGTSSPKYIVASNKISHNALRFVNEMIDEIYSKSSRVNLQAHEAAVLYSRLSDIHKVLKRIDELYKASETLNCYQNMIDRLAIAQKHLNTVVSAS